MGREMNRRKFTTAIGSVGVTSLAGCSTDSEGPVEDSANRNGSDNEGETVEPNYDVELNLKDNYDTRQDEEIDLVESVDVFKILDGETSVEDSDDYELLDSSDYSIEQIYQVRDHDYDGPGEEVEWDEDEDVIPEGYRLEINGTEFDSYSTEFFKQLSQATGTNLYEEITKEVTENNNLSSQQLLPGQTKLGLELNIEDGENEETLNTEYSTFVETSQEHMKERLWIEDPELYTELRLKGRELAFENWDEFGRLHEDLMEEVDFTQETEEFLDDVNWDWAREASDIVTGGASGQSYNLSYTIELGTHKTPEADDLKAWMFNNPGHNTVGATNGEVAWDVESDGTRVATPLYSGSEHTGSSSSETALMNPERSMDSTKGTFKTMVDVIEVNTMDEVFDRDRFENSRGNIRITDEAAIEIMDIMGESETGLPSDETWRNMEDYGLTVHFSPHAGLRFTEEEISQ